MKYKKLTHEQLIISLDRLTRFKPTKEKYLRVFFDIILSNLTEPRIKKSDLEKMDYTDITHIAEKIINGSLNTDSVQNSEITTSINAKLIEYENTIFRNDSDTQKLLNNHINYERAVQFIKTDSVINLRWLKLLQSANNLTELREKNSLKYPIEKVLLVEGLTEEILLPEFARFLGYDFDQNGIYVIGAGGKNQVVKLYYKLSQELKIPIFLLLDKDAEENINQIMPRLRKSDKIHPVSSGEFEDMLSKHLIVKTVNKEFKNFISITENELPDNISRAKCLEDIFKTKGLHEFKKADFAKMVKENICEDADISSEIKEIIYEIFV